MRYTVRKNVIWIVGRIWQPGYTCSQVLHPDMRDESLRDDDGQITRDSIQWWLAAHAGDFQEVIDFSASIENGENTIEIPWGSDDGECAYLDTLPEED